MREYAKENFLNALDVTKKPKEPRMLEYISLCSDGSGSVGLPLYDTQYMIEEAKKAPAQTHHDVMSTFSTQLHGGFGHGQTQIRRYAAATGIQPRQVLTNTEDALVEKNMFVPGVGGGGKPRGEIQQAKEAW